ncbi:MAG TPA: GtrA family protein [Croceibacterium sp.]|jgi:putative flippase GtrA
MHEWTFPRLAGQLLRFGMVGGVVTLLSALIYYVSAARFGVPPLLANVLGYLVGGALGYVLHSRISFRGYGRRDRTALRTGRFAVVSLITFALNSLFVGVLTGPLHGATWWPVVPMIGVTPLVAFYLNRRWVFG